MLRREEDGAEHVRSALSKQAIAAVEQLFDLNGRPGARLLADQLQPIAGLLGSDGEIGRVARRFGGSAMRPIRAILLDKTPDTNWSLDWHQDRVIAVEERREVRGFQGWSIKGGLVHVQAPAKLMACMLTLRIHVDAVDEENAPLRILRGSHKLRRLSEEQIETLAASAPKATCLADRGDIWVYQTLVVHASAEERRSGQRRVLQIDFADFELPGGLRWAYSTLHEQLAQRHTG
jgi:hypothetical protein